MTFAVYSNKGTLDMRAFTIMGINAKPKTDSPIGYFGTGLKYAIAVLIRNGCRVLIHDGLGNEWGVVAFDDTFRDKGFTMMKLLKMNGKREELALPFTTELGKNWKLWMVLRELESNMRDESGSFELTPHRPPSEIDEVRIIVEGEHFINCVVNERRQVFFDLHTSGKFAHESAFDVDYVPQETNALFYRGILVHTIEEGNTKRWQFTYNIKERMELTEDRTLQGRWQFNQKLGELFALGELDYVIALCNNPQAQEWEAMDIRGHPSSYTPKNRDYIEAYFRGAPGNMVHPKLAQLAARMIVEKRMEKSRDLQTDEQELLDKAVLFLRMAGYSVDDYPITVAEELPDNVLGMASDGKILLSHRNFEMGYETLIQTIFEEWCHLKFGWYDGQREFQDYLLRQAIVHLFRATKLERKLAHALRIED